MRLADRRSGGHFCLQGRYKSFLVQEDGAGVDGERSVAAEEE